MKAAERIETGEAPPEPPPDLLVARESEQALLSQQWRHLSRAATLVAILTSPAIFVWFHRQIGWGIGWSIVATFLTAAAFRGLVDIAVRRLIPWPTLFGQEDIRVKDEDIVNRRRAWCWSKR